MTVSLATHFESPFFVVPNGESKRVTWKFIVLLIALQALISRTEHYSSIYYYMTMRYFNRNGNTIYLSFSLSWFHLMMINNMLHPCHFDCYITYCNVCLAILKLLFHTRCKLWRKVSSQSTQLISLLMLWSHLLVLFQ